MLKLFVRSSNFYRTNAVWKFYSENEFIYDVFKCVYGNPFKHANGIKLLALLINLVTEYVGNYLSDKEWQYSLLVGAIL